MARANKGWGRTRTGLPRVGDSITVGPIGPIPVVASDDPRRVKAVAAARIAQSATTCDELIELVLRHDDPITRMEAVPRLKARFPDDEGARMALLSAVRDVDDGVRCAAISAVSDLNLPEAPDLLVGALRDPEPDVRFFAAIGLRQLDDSRAPEDPEVFAYHST
jgi:HEAT repeat protein